MDVFEAIEKRFSVRAYQDKPVEDDKLLRVLEAGRSAPSARNRQEMKFVVVRDPQQRAAVVKGAEQEWMVSAPVIIAVVGTTPDVKMHCQVPTDPVDCAIAIDHMTLAAVAEGLGTCWIGHFDQKACCKVLGVPETAKIVELLTLGYPAAEQPPRKRQPLDKMLCHDRFA